ncbi:MAG: hypothetical protein ACC628_05395 [Pirellulaceae bacterium]
MKKTLRVWLALAVIGTAFALGCQSSSTEEASDLPADVQMPDDYGGAEQEATP